MDESSNGRFALAAHIDRGVGRDRTFDGDKRAIFRNFSCQRRELLLAPSQAMIALQVAFIECCDWTRPPCRLRRVGTPLQRTSTVR